jgi:hypothetical protein
LAVLRPESIPALADVIDEYLSQADLAAHCALFEVEPPSDGYTINCIDLARMLAFESEHGNNRRLLNSLIETTKTRCMNRIARTTFERREYHEQQLERISTVERQLAESAAPAELTVPAAKPFTAQSELRRMLSTAETPVTVVDNYVGPGTLDCLVDVDQEIRLLTGAHAESIKEGFDRAVAAFSAEGRTIEVRRHAGLHDRYVAFNGRCWLVGSSIKDAGKKDFNLIEVIGSRETILADIDAKWSEATPHKP